MKINIQGNIVNTDYIVNISQIEETNNNYGYFHQISFTINLVNGSSIIISNKTNKFEGIQKISKDVYQDLIKDNRLKIFNLRSKLISSWLDNEKLQKLEL